MAEKIGTSRLYDTAIRAAIRKISDITSFGDIPERFVQPILSAVKNPEHLATLESNSPQLYGHTDRHWKRVIRTVIDNGDERYAPPEDPHDWYRTYKHLKKQDDRRLKDDMKAAFHATQEKQKEKDKFRTMLVPMKQLPKDHIREEAKRMRQKTSLPARRTSLQVKAGTKQINPAMLRPNLDSEFLAKRRALKKDADIKSAQREQERAAKRAATISPHVIQPTSADGRIISTMVTRMPMSASSSAASSPSFSPPAKVPTFSAAAASPLSKDMVAGRGNISDTSDSASSSKSLKRKASSELDRPKKISASEVAIKAKVIMRKPRTVDPFIRRPVGRKRSAAPK